MKTKAEADWALEVIMAHGGSIPLSYDNGYGNKDCELVVEILRDANAAVTGQRTYTLFWLAPDGDDESSEVVDEVKAREIFWDDVAFGLLAETFGGPEAEKTKEVNICTCNIQDLAAFGCKCGQIERERARK